MHYSRAFLDITRRYDAEDKLRALTSEMEGRAAASTRELEAANDKLEATNERLSRIVSEREMLLREVNHRAKSSLAVAASLLAIQRGAGRPTLCRGRAASRPRHSGL